MSLAIKNLTKEELIEKYFEQEELINKLNRNIDSLSDELSVSINLFENSPTPMWEEDVTELINYIEEIKSRSNTSFKDYLDENPNELIVCIKKIKPLNVNNALVKLHKARSKEELLNNLDQVFIEEAMPAFKEEIISIANGNTTFISLTKAKTLNDEILDLKLYLQITKAKSDSSIKYTAIVSTVNVTDQLKIEAKIQKSERTLRTILDASEDIAILVDPNGFILESNKACQDFYNVNKIDLVGRKLQYFATKEVIENRRIYFRRAISDKKTITFKNSAYDKIWISTISPILDVNGDVEKLVIFHRDITGKHYSDKKLKDSELKFKSIFNNIQTSIVHIDKDGYITDINEYHLKHISKSKRTRKDYIGKNILERHSIIKAGIVEYYRELLKGKQFEIKNVFFPITTGEESAYFNIQGIPLFDSDSVQGAILTTEDVTEEVTGKQKIIKIEERLSLALEGAEIGLWDHDLVNDKVWRSKKWFEMLGYKKEDFSDSREIWENLIHPDDKELAFTARAKYYKNKCENIKIEHRLKNSQNNYQWIINWGKVIERDIHGNPIRAAGVHLDITELKEAHNEVLKSQKRYKNLFENQPTIIWEEDFSIVKQKLDSLKNNGVTDFRTYFKENPEFVKECAREIKIVEMNLASLSILEVNNMEELYDSIPKYFNNEEAWQVFSNELTALANEELNFESEFRITTHKGNEKYLYLTLNVSPENKNDFKSVLVSIQDITERKSAEKRNRDLAKLLESSPLAYLITDLNGNITDINPALEELTGYSRKELIGKNPEIFNAETNVQEIQNNIFETLQSKRIWNGEILNKKKNGSLFYNYSTIFPLYNESGETNSYAAFHEDITERIVANNLIREQEEYLKSIFSSAPVGIGVVTNRVFNKVNLKLCKMTGYNEKELLGKSSEILYPDLEEFNRVGFQKYSQIDNVGSGTLETKFKTKAGSIINILLSSTPIDKNDLLKGVTFTALDITDRKLNEESLRQYENIVASSSDMLALVDKNYKYLAANKSYFNSFNLSENELIGKTVAEVFGDTFFNKVLKPNADKCMNGEDVNYQEWINFSNSDKAYMDISYFPYKDNENNILGFVVNARNITDRKLTDEALNEQMRINQQILETTMDGYILADTEGNIHEVNPSYSKMIGYSQEELQKMNIDKLEIALPKEVIEQRIQQMVAEGGLNFKTQHKHKLGHSIDLDVSITIIKKKETVLIAALVRDISEQIIAEMKIRESEDKFHKIFRNSPDPIVLTKLSDGEIVEVNDATLKITETKLEDLIGKKTTEFLIWENLADRERYVEKLYKTSRVHDFDTNFIIGEGKIRNCLISGELIRINNIDYVLGIIRDITEKKEAEKALIESEEKYRTLVENQTDLVVEINKLNQFTFVSKSYCELFGRSEVELIGKSFLPLIHEEDRSLTELEMNKLFSAPYTCRLEQRAMTAKGWRWLEWNDTAQLDESNNVKSIMGVGRDITEKKEAEIALKASEEKFYKIFKNSPDAIILTRMKDGEIIDVNDSTTEIIGYERSEIIGKRIIQIKLWHSTMDRDNYVNLLNKHGISKSLIVEFIKKDGEKRTGMLSGVLLQLNTEKYIFEILRDITEKTIFEKKLQESNERLRNLARYMNKVKEDERKNFAREVHDDLGQKLTALNLDISWIKKNVPEELVEIRKQFDPVLDLINQSIITVQKISTELRPGILDDLGLANAIQWQSNEISRRTKLNFSLNLYKHELELDDNVKTALFRVFQEALTNIVRHANASNVLVNLLIKEKKLIFEIIDDGKGISESEINEFTSFGIIGMKERIASIDGEIFFSRLSKGTMLQISIPIKVEL